MAAGYRKKTASAAKGERGGRWAGAALLAGLSLAAPAAQGDPCPNGQPGHLSPVESQRAKAAIRQAEALKQRATRKDHDDALALLLRTEAQLGGVYSPELAQVRGLLAGIYKNRDDFTQARVRAAQEYEINRCLGESAETLSDDLQFMAQIEDAADRPGAGLRHLQEALAPCDPVPEVKHRSPACVEARNTLAVLLQHLGRLDEAGAAYRQTLAEGEVLKPDKVPVYRQNLATFYHEIGAYEDAVRELEEVRGRVGPADLPDVLENLAAAYDALATKQRRTPGQAAAAAVTDQKAGEAFRATMASFATAAVPREKHAHLWNNYAYYLRERRQFPQAEQACRKGLTLIAEQPDPRPYRAVRSRLHLQLARVFADQGQWCGALAEHQKALDLLDPHDGRDYAHWTPTTGLFEVLVKGADIHQRLGQTGEARTKLDAALRISEIHLGRVGATLASGRLGHFAEVLRSSQELIYQLAAQHPDDAELVALGLRTVLLRKDRVQEEAIEQSHLSGRLTADERDGLRRIHKDMAALAAKDVASEKDDQQVLDKQRQLNDQADALVARTRGLHVRHLPPPEAIEAAVRARLGSDAALIEVASFGPPAGAGERRYLAFVVAPRQPTRVVNLGPEGALDQALAGLRGDLLKGSFWRRGAVPDASRRLYQDLFAATGLVPQALRRLYFAPQGLTYGLPLASLHDGTRYLLERVPVIHLTSGRDLLRSLPPVPRDERPLEVVSFVAPDLDAALPGPAGDPRLIEAVRGAQFTALPFAKAEGTFLRDAVKARAIYSGGQATLERLLQVQGPIVLHLAMHSFVLPFAPRVGLPEVDRALVLAGARRSPAQGLLTGLQVSAIDLWGTQVAFLSACQLVDRDVSGSLWRAFLTAGAETVVTTLAVHDLDGLAAAGVMLDYYGGLSRGQERPEALRQALLRAYQRYGQPSYLSAFATFGADGPLRRPLRIEPRAAARMRWRNEAQVFGPWLLIGGGALVLAVVLILATVRSARARRPI